MEIKEPEYQLELSFENEPIEYNLIDEDFDIDFANSLAKIESFNKHLYRPNTYLHKWWARRCGTTFRAILKHLVRDKTKNDYYSGGGLEGQIICDPMMGGGTTLHEAIRLGANVIGADIDPIPILQARAALTESPLKTLENAFTDFFNELRSQIGHYYRVECPICEKSFELKFALYGVKKRCGCQEAIFIDNYIFRYNSDGSKIRICPETYNIFHDNHLLSRSNYKHSLPLYEKNKKICSCGNKFAEDLSLPYFKRYVPIVFIGECFEHGIFFTSPDKSDLDLISYADEKRGELKFDENDFDIIPGPKSSDLHKRGIKNYLDLFTSRQLIYLRKAIDTIKKYEHTISLKLAMVVSASIEFNSLLCGYKGAAKNRPGAIRHTFSHHAYSFPYTALENNPVYKSKSSGTLQNIFYNRFIRGYKWAIKPVERSIKNKITGKIPIAGEVDLGKEYRKIEKLNSGERRYLLIQGSSSKLNIPNKSVDHVVTDPPYFDSVQYSDLAAFFRVWLRQLLPGEVNWDYSLDAAAVEQNSNGNGQYETVLSKIFIECNRILKNDRSRLIFTFHHWNPKGWAELTIALKKSGFLLINYYVIHSENQSSVHIINQNALVHDLILVLGKKKLSYKKYWKQPDIISKSDSYDFCYQCGLLLGYILNSNLTKQKIKHIWRDKIEK
ncbi:DNA methyltransferase [Desulfococcaceae bacterium HSG9]|nr:DNA methyltransferase [Desulfococcaceae bacterium HSG9]